MTDPAARLNAHLAVLDAEDAAGQARQKTVGLDQQAVGRLSRMDALQNQAMAQATARRRVQSGSGFWQPLPESTLTNTGIHTACGDEIGAERLATDPAIALCTECMRKK